jgi:hypothetical protein
MCLGDSTMLSEFIGELKGKITGQRVLSVEGPKMETSVSASGNLRGAQVTETLTYVASRTSKGVLHGVGNGVIMSTEGELVTYTGEGIGKLDSSGTLKWRGAIFFTTESTGKLSSLNNQVGVFEAQVDAEGNFSDKTWEWK